MHWPTSLYWRIAIGFVLFLATMLVVQAMLFVWVVARSGRTVPGQSPGRFSETVAFDLANALTREPDLDLPHYVHDQYSQGVHPFFVMLTDGRVVTNGGTSFPEPLLRMARVRLQRRFERPESGGFGRGSRRPDFRPEGPPRDRLPRDGPRDGPPRDGPSFPRGLRGDDGDRDSAGVLRGDRDRLEQALQNLAGNALRYAPKESTIRLGAGREGMDVVLSVEDEGPGIAPEHLPHIFDRFYKAEPSRAVDRADEATTAANGSGLGLSIVKAIVERHGGRIAVDSRPGRTVFQLALSARVSEVPDATGTTSRDTSSRILARSQSTGRG